MITLSLDMVQYDCPYIDASDDHEVSFSGMHWDFHAERHELEARVLVEAADSDTLDRGLGALRGHHAMDEYSLLSRRGDTAVIRNEVAETAAMATIRRHGGYLTGPFRATAGSEIWHVGFDSEGSADAALAELDRDNEFSVESRDALTLDDYHDVVQHVGPAKRLLDGCRNLSAVERDTVQHAYREGYFRSPRDATLGTLADEFGVSKPAVSKNLRRGERKVLREVLAAMEDLDAGGGAE